MGNKDWLCIKGLSKSEIGFLNLESTLTTGTLSSWNCARGQRGHTHFLKSQEHLSLLKMMPHCLDLSHFLIHVSQKVIQMLPSLWDQFFKCDWRMKYQQDLQSKPTWGAGSVSMLSTGLCSYSILQVA